MNETGTEAIIAEIEKKAEEQVASILREAEGKAQGILAAAEEKAEKQKTTIVEAARRDAEREHCRIVVKARTEAKQRVLRMKEKLVEEVFHRAQEMLHKIEEHQEIDGVRYDDVMKHLLCNSLAALGEAEAVVYCREQDREIFSSSLFKSVEEWHKKETGEKCSLRLGKDPIHTTGGIMVRNADERIQVDNTFEAIIDRLHEVFCAEITHTLFEK